jgi:hypothetical protein
MEKALCLNPVILTPYSNYWCRRKVEYGDSFPLLLQPPIIHDNTLLGYA